MKKAKECLKKNNEEGAKYIWYLDYFYKMFSNNKMSQSDF